MASDPAKTCFVIAPIGKPGSEARKRSDQVLKYILRPVIEPHGYKVLRADELSESGAITSQVIQHVMDDDLAVADLAGHNPNVFYELALRHAIHKPVIQLAADGESLPFDVSGQRSIFVDHKDLDSVEGAKGELECHVVAIEADPSKVDSPVTQAIEIVRLQRSDDPFERVSAEILGGIAQLQTDVSSIRAVTHIALQQDLRIRSALRTPSNLSGNGPLPAEAVLDLFKQLLRQLRTEDDFLGIVDRFVGGEQKSSDDSDYSDYSEDP